MRSARATRWFLGRIVRTDPRKTAAAAPASPSETDHPREPALLAGRAAGRPRVAAAADGAGAPDRRRLPEPDADSQPAFRRRNWYGSWRPRESLDAEQLQVLDKPAAVARPAAAECHFADESAQPGEIARVASAPGGDQQRQRRRLEPRHRLGEQDKAIVKLMHQVRWRHGYRPDLQTPARTGTEPCAVNEPAAVRRTPPRRPCKRSLPCGNRAVGRAGRRRSSEQ